MLNQDLPARPSLEHLRNQAKSLLAALRQNDPAAWVRARGQVPNLAEPVRLHQIQWILASEYGFATWAELKHEVELRIDRARDLESKLALLFEAYSVPPLRRRVLSMVQATPELPKASLYSAIACLDFESVQAFVSAEPDLILNAGGPLESHPLIYLTYSPLVCVTDLQPQAVEIAQLLLSNGARVDVSFRWKTEDARGFDLPILFGVIGNSNAPEVAKVLIEAGANINDNESMYHSCEFRDHQSLKLLLARGAKISGTNALPRMLDFEDLEGLNLLLEAGADVHEMPILVHALVRGRSNAIIGRLLEAGADPDQKDHGPSARELAFWLHGPDSALVAGSGWNPEPVDALMHACWMGDLDQVATIKRENPSLPTGRYSRLFANAAMLGRTESMAAFLAAGFTFDDRGDSQEGPLHAASLAGQLATVKELIRLGADVKDRKNMYQSEPISWAIVGSQSWAADGIERDYPAVVKVLLEAGATLPDKFFGSAEVVEVLEGWTTKAE